MAKKIKIYLSDEGYGHIVRQSAIITELLLLDSTIQFTIQTHKHASFLKKLMGDHIIIIDKYNNITWDKKSNSSPDIELIKKRFSTYQDDTTQFIEDGVKSDKDFDCIISDFVYEAFTIADKLNIPSFGVAHFTWDWFFSKLYPPPIHTNTFNYLLKQVSFAHKLYFPPYTPQEILTYHEDKKVEVPLIVRKKTNIKTKLRAGNKFRILIIDSGAGLLKSSIEKASRQFQKLKDFEFLISETIQSDADNVFRIPKDELFVDYIPESDLVIGRAGFNTISECIAYKTPMLLLSEAMNPEMNENIINVKHSGLGSFISLENFTENISNILPRFIEGEYKEIQSNMQNHQIATNGAEIIANDILNQL